MEGLVNLASYLIESQAEWMTADGRVQQSSLDEIKVICFVSDSGKSDLFVTHSVFERRPRLQGLWTRFLFLDGDLLEGVLPHNLLDWPRQGYLAVPPQARANRQRVFVPRSSLVATELRGVVGGGHSMTAKPDTVRLPGERQIRMFE